MNMTVSTLIGCIFSFLSVGVHGHMGSHNKNTTSGEIRGVFVDFFNVTKYLGIPYAEAPVGGLRFKPPVRKNRMEGVYNATFNTLICPQAFEFPRQTPVTQTEDCLRLDIYAPLAARKSNPLPVMIWIYGGGYAAGDTNTYDSTFLAVQGQVIVVALNYRLGILGFFNTMDDHSVGNFGLRDQCLGIEWIVDNIGEFGGNASQITIFGVSAGGASGMQLAMSSLCVGKFQRVIAQSGSPEALWAYNRDPKKSAYKLADDLHCPRDSAGLLKCLRTKTIQELNNYQRKHNSLFDAPEWAPTYSKDVFPDNPIDIVKGKESPGLRRFKSLDFLTGVCYEESEIEFRAEIAEQMGNEDPTKLEINEEQAKLTDKQVDEKIKKSLSLYLNMASEETDKMLDVIKFQLTDWKKQNDPFLNLRRLIQFKSDILYNIGSIRSANSHSSSNSRSTSDGTTYFYQLKPKPSWQPDRPWQDGATHADDIAFVFGFVQSLQSSDAEKQLALDIMTYWTNFAKSGSPNGPEAVTLTWPMYETQSQKYIQLDLSSKVDMYPYAKRFAFWDSFFLPQLQKIREKLVIVSNSGMTLQCSPVFGISMLFSLIYSLI